MLIATLPLRLQLWSAWQIVKDIQSCQKKSSTWAEILCSSSRMKFKKLKILEFPLHIFFIVLFFFFHLQESEGLVFHYWALFDGHAGSGAAVFASRLLQHHIACQLQTVIEILRNFHSLPPTVLGEEPDSSPYLQGNPPGPQRSLTRAASLRGAAGAPSSPSSTPPPPRFYMEKKIQHESLVIGAIENAFKEMVSVG